MRMIVIGLPTFFMLVKKDQGQWLQKFPKRMYYLSKWNNF